MGVLESTRKPGCPGIPRRADGEGTSLVTRREEEGPSFPPSLSSLPREIFEGKLRVINSELLFRERKTISREAAR